MWRITRRALLAAALSVGAAVTAAPAGGAGHPTVPAGAACVIGRCHPGLLAPDPRGGSAHPPAADGDCASCHDLALAPATRYVKGAPGAGDEGPERARPWDVALCAGCHGEALAAKDATAATTGFVHAGKNLHALHVQAARGPRCLPCHDPHAAPQPLLLRARIPARGGAVIPQEFRAEKNGGWCRTGCHAPKSYRR